MLAVVTKTIRYTAALGAVFVALLGLAACGKSIKVPESQQRLHQGAVLFNLRCSGCHTLDSAAASGSKSKSQVLGGERTNGPNFNIRKEAPEQVLYAIRNGGFSGAIMPANIVTGKEADELAAFVHFLLGPDARFFCGSVVFVDGGTDALMRADDFIVKPFKPAKVVEVAQKVLAAE